jgi:hypothetical protein
MRTLRFPVMVAALAVATGTSAQEPVCLDTATIIGCFTSTVMELRTGASGSEVQAGAHEALAGLVAGPNLAGALAQSAIRDFLPRFAGTLLTADLDHRPAIDLRLNAPLTKYDAAASRRLAFQAGATLHEPELFPSLVDSIPEALRSASRDRLAADLEEGDDATLFTAVAIESRRLGRSFVPHQAFLNALTSDARTAAGASLPEVAAARSEFDRQLRGINAEAIDPERRGSGECPDEQFIDATTLRVDCLRSEVWETIKPVLRRAAVLEARRQSRIGTILEDAGFIRIAELVNNQPQLILSGEFRNRLAAVGPSEWSGRVRYEVGSANLNELHRYCARRPDGRSNLACLRSYMDSAGAARALARGARTWIAAVARYRPRYTVDLVQDSARIDLRAGTGLGVGVGHGFYLGSPTDAPQKRDRLDLHASYDFAAGDDLRQSRWIAGIIYTLGVSRNVSGVLGLVWANRPEYVGGADRRLGANLGLTYKLTRNGDATGGDVTSP